MIVEMKIIAMDDPAPWPEDGKKKRIYSQLEKVGILQSGTQTGATTVMLMGTGENGELLALECSAAMFRCIDAAVVGAVERFGK